MQQFKDSLRDFVTSTLEDFYNCCADRLNIYIEISKMSSDNHSHMRQKLDENWVRIIKLLDRLPSMHVVSRQLRLTPLDIAATLDLVEVVDEVIDRGAKIDFLSNDEIDAVQWAVLHDSAHCLEYFLKSGYSPLVTRPTQDWNLVGESLVNDSVECFQVLLEHLKPNASEILQMYSALVIREKRPEKIVRFLTEYIGTDSKRSIA